MDPTPTRPNPRGSHRPVSRRRYMMRRLGALVVLSGLLVSIVWGVSLLVRGSGDSVASNEPASSPSSASEDSSAGASTAPPAASEGGNAPPVTAQAPGTDGGSGTPDGVGASSSSGASQEPQQPEDTSPPTPQDPAQVYIAGDSDAGMFGPYLEELLADTGVVETTLDYEVSSGLARPDFFDWPEHLRNTIPEVDPDVVVVSLGGNDAQGLSEETSEEYVVEPADVEPAEWRAEYGRRVGEVMDHLSSDGRTLIWVGIPNTESHELTERLRIQNAVVRNQVEKRPDVLFVDTWSRFSGRDGGYADYVIDPRDGQGKLVRTDDNFHLNETGNEILALDIAEAVRTELRERGANI